MTVGRLPLPPLPAHPVTCVRCGKIQKESEFAASVDCGWLSWGVGLLLVRPLKWTFSSLLGGGRVPPEEPYVVLDLVKVCVSPSERRQRLCPCVHPPSAGVFQEKAAEVLGTFRRSDLSSSPVLSFSELYGLCAGVCADESTLCMALLQLQRDKQVLVCLQDGEKVTPPPNPHPGAGGSADHVTSAG